MPTGLDSLLRLTSETTHARLSLLGGFELVCAGSPVRLQMSAQRLVAFLALQDRPLLRLYIAGVLWLAIIVVHIIAMVKGVKGERLVLPVVSQYADKF